MAKEIKTTAFQNFIKFVQDKGVFKTLFYAAFFVLISMMIYIAANPKIMFEAYDRYESQKHSESFSRRLEISPKVQDNIDKLLLESNSDRAYVIEMHNGKYNSAGLSFNFGSLIYESDKEGVEPIREEYADFTLEKYPFFSKIFEEGYWNGSVEELKKVDPRLGTKMELTGSKYIVMAMLYNEGIEIGFLGITFTDNEDINPAAIHKLMQKYTARIAPLLDGNKKK